MQSIHWDNHISQSIVISIQRNILYNSRWYTYYCTIHVWHICNTEESCRLPVDEPTYRLYRQLTDNFGLGLFGHFNNVRALCNYNLTIECHLTINYINLLPLYQYEESGSMLIEIMSIIHPTNNWEIFNLTLMDFIENIYESNVIDEYDFVDLVSGATKTDFVAWKCGCFVLFQLIKTIK